MDQSQGWASWPRTDRLDRPSDIQKCYRPLGNPRPPGQLALSKEARHDGGVHGERQARARERARGDWPPVGDRKSTRLNSSHANISYAVFCLKKKKLSIYDKAGLDTVISKG